MSSHPPQREPLLVARDLEKRFPVRGTGPFGRRRFVHAVDGVSFAVAHGETVGVVGESGCGKSTTARVVARLIDADAGTLTFDGRSITALGSSDLKSFRAQLQMVFQDSFASLNPRLDVLDAIAYGPRVHGLAKRAARDRARSLLARVGLEPSTFGARYPHELSGGQRQRINIARALAFEPRMLILDEAVAALDKSVQAQVLNLLQALKAEHALTYLFISHDLQVVHYMADRVIVMYLGQVVETAPTDAIYRRARHPYTRALLAAVPSMDPSRRTMQATIEGDPPNPIDPPDGCRFRERCPHAAAVCATHAPALRETEPGHRAACHLDDPSSGHPDAVAMFARATA
jgi:peptide/nickel transport system ATP-binding protein